MHDETTPAGRTLHGFLRPKSSGTLANVMTDAEAAAAPVDPDPAPAAEEKAARRSRGDLEKLVKMACDQFVTGSYVPSATKSDRMTPTEIIRWIMANTTVEGKKPSGGAVTEILKRWQKIGYAELATGPVGFARYTEAAYSEGLTALRKAWREAQKAAAPAADEAATSDDQAETAA